jgi:hypothetical protein
MNSRHRLPVVGGKRCMRTSVRSEDKVHWKAFFDSASVMALARISI